jgi:hypothetical protein
VQPPKRKPKELQTALRSNNGTCCSSSRDYQPFGVGDSFAIVTADQFLKPFEVTVCADGVNSVLAFPKHATNLEGAKIDLEI